MPIMRDFAVATVLVDVSEGENNLVRPILVRAVGLGTKETLPSLERAPVPSDDMGDDGEFVSMRNEDRFSGVEGADPARADPAFF